MAQAQPLDLKGMVRDLPFNIQHNLCLLLNPTQRNDYRALAAHMEYNPEEIKTFGLASNPTETLLRQWGTKKDSTNGQLVKYLEKMERSDAIDVLNGRTCTKKRTITTDGETKELKPLLVRDIDFFTRRDIAIKLNQRQDVSGKNFREFADAVGMSKVETDAIACKEDGNPTEEIFTWWGPKKEATVSRMIEIMKNMGRDDVREILEDKYPNAELCQQRFADSQDFGMDLDEDESL